MYDVKFTDEFDAWLSGLKDEALQKLNSLLTN